MIDVTQIDAAIAIAKEEAQIVRNAEIFEILQSTGFRELVDNNIAFMQETACPDVDDLKAAVAVAQAATFWFGVRTGLAALAAMNGSRGAN